jgi:hypothetical protein
MTTELANRAYDVLVEVCGAREDWRTEFVAYLTNGDDRHEYRFQGSLGFGGKLYQNRDGVYVTCYREDKTPERQQAILKANEILAAVVTPYL